MTTVERLKQVRFPRLGRWTSWLGPVLVVSGLLLFWELLLSNPDNVSAINTAIRDAIGWNPKFRAFSPTMLPRPSSIARAFFITPSNGRGGIAFFAEHTQASLFAALLGFALGNAIAVMIATLFVYVKLLERALMPIALALRSIPLVAITPLLLRIRFTLADMPAVKENPLLYALFGTENTIKMIVVVIIVFFPTLVNVARGLESVDLPAIELLHSLNASEWYIYWRVRVPTALPLAFAAFKVAASASVLGVVVSEWLSSNQGLGYIMYQGGTGTGVSEMWVAMIITTCLAVLLFWVVDIVEKITIPWHQSVIALKQVMDGSGQTVRTA
jgi:NitT/TauT family transport system permease protein